MMAPLYFIHGMPPDSDELDGLMPSCVCDLDYIDRIGPTAVRREPEVEIKFSHPPEDWWPVPYAPEAKDWYPPERRRRMPEHWVSREAILFVAGFAIGAWVVAAAVMWL